MCSEVFFLVTVLSLWDQQKVNVNTLIKEERDGFILQILYKLIFKKAKPNSAAHLCRARMFFQFYHGRNSCQVSACLLSGDSCLEELLLSDTQDGFRLPFCTDLLFITKTIKPQCVRSNTCKWTWRQKYSDLVMTNVIVELRKETGSGHKLLC